MALLPSMNTQLGSVEHQMTGRRRLAWGGYSLSSARPPL